MANQQQTPQQQRPNQNTGFYPGLQSQPQGGHYAPPMQYQKTNGLAVTSCVLALLGLALIPVILGHIALRQIRSNGDSGSGFAYVGLVLGYLEIIGYTLALAAAGGLMLWIFNS